MQGALQENVITLLCTDPKAIPLLQGVVDPELFDTSVYREIVRCSLEYYRQYKKPIADHLPDFFEDKLKGKNAELYEETFMQIKEFSHTINREYVMNEVRTFIRQQNLKLSIKDAAELVMSGKLDEAETVLQKAQNSNLSIFDPGISLRNTEDFLNFIEPDNECIWTGVPDLDRLRICPARKEMFTFLALPNKGKSWFAINCARNALFQHKNVLHITLEMSEKRVARRYAQNFFALANREEEQLIPAFIYSEEGAFKDLSYIKKMVKTFSDHDIKVYLQKRMATFKYRNLIIKEFPTGQLTVAKLVAYIDSLINTGFHPDFIAIDYPDLMKRKTGMSKQESLCETYEEIRGLAAIYNCAILALTQANREGMLETWLTPFNLAGDFTKAATSDNLVSHNVSDTEEMMNIARVYIAKARNEERANNKIAITQKYAIGQYCLDSYMMKSQKDTYWSIIKANQTDDEIEHNIKSRKPKDFSKKESVASKAKKSMKRSRKE